VEIEPLEPRKLCHHRQRRIADVGQVPQRQTCERQARESKDTVGADPLAAENFERREL
jgi:hypothetical protein